MIKFIDLNNGQIFDADLPYTFWFDGEQSIDIIYSKYICVLCDKSSIDVKLNYNGIFKLIDDSKIYISDNDIDNVHYTNYIDINDLYVPITEDMQGNKYYIKTYNGTQFNDKYLYVIYFTANTNTIGEFIESFVISTVNETKICNIGADFYDENESLSINLSNFGVELPESIQKALYSSNINEDNKDNILINRKLKELISNYWDIIANKGSYKSLINSLKWFEYTENGHNIVRLREIWKHKSDPKETYDDRALCSILEDKYKDSLYGFSKTVYFALYATLEHLVDGEYDKEMNPALEYNVIRWGFKELSLKMSILGKFYEKFFMPIHTNLIHSTIEDIVFTNTIKNINGSTLERIDYIGNFDYIKDNIKKEYILGNVSTQVNKNTELGVNWNGEYDESDIITIGVDDFNTIAKINNNNDLKTFNSQYYSGPGVIIPIELTIPNIDNNDFIKRIIISFIPDGQKDWYTTSLYNIYNPINNTVILKFNLLCKEAKTYNYKLQFITADSKIYVKDIKFEVLDPDNIGIDLYKIHPKQYICFKDINNENILNYMFKIQKYYNKDKFIQYINIDKKGLNNIKLNQLLVLYNESDNQKSYYDDPLLNNYYFMFTRNSEDLKKALDSNLLLYREILNNKIESLTHYEKEIILYETEFNRYKKLLLNSSLSEFDKKIINNKIKEYQKLFDSANNAKNRTNDNIKQLNSIIEQIIINKNKIKPYLYTICICKEFDYDFSTAIPIDASVLRNDFIFFPEFHENILMTGNNKSDYIISNNELTYLIPHIKFGKYITEYEWEFENASTLETIKLPASSQEPLIANLKDQPLPRGYYNVTFKFKLDEVLHEIKLNSLFLIS